jgi:predicted acylesterase/phospholipase RssA
VQYVRLAEIYFDVERITVSDRKDFRRFDAEQFLKQVVQAKTKSQNTGMAQLKLPISNSENCGTVVVCSSMDGAATLFRSYGSTVADSCIIWEAAMATLAVPSIFKPVFIREAGDWFITGPPRYNNPAELVLAEARSIWDDAEHFCLVSVGNGTQKYPGPITRLAEIFDGQVPDANIPAALMEAKLVELCVNLSLNSELVHHRLLNKMNSRETYSYYRFNSQDLTLLHSHLDPLGLQEWKVGARMEHTNEGGRIKRNDCVAELLESSYSASGIGHLPSISR